MLMRRHAQFPVTRSVLRARPSRRSAAVYTAGANIRARKRGTESITLFSACEYVYSHHYTKRPPGPPLTPRARGTRVSAAFIAMLLAPKPPGRAPVTVLFSARAKCTCTLATVHVRAPTHTLNHRIVVTARPATALSHPGAQVAKPPPLSTTRGTAASACNRQLTAQ